MKTQILTFRSSSRSLFPLGDSLIFYQAQIWTLQAGLAALASLLSFLILKVVLQNHLDEFSEVMT